ncbi:hypothetical protein K450DRAFT_196304 [Umbelopsis ramanniana AG]|uniref:Uncharacterized protein n=1 Tax=Umbelopsis ramanniana AG TaxID=1314678 RepID=A0AAD5EHP0_UMBRA|nr:uncharacterized protein K450DRAFT_196304 [Umbelopsis ramanniana AG]KAI8583106.1 hypothetical protein K450DRAFT_196304 [Umbelopsis ramanniana AG]
MAQLKILFAEGKRLFDLSKDAQALYGRHLNFKILDIGYTFIKATIANTDLMTEQATLQIFELACIFGKSSLGKVCSSSMENRLDLISYFVDVGEYEKADQTFNEAKDLQINTWNLNPEITSKYHELQFILHFYLAEMYLSMNNSQACSLMVDIATQYINELTTAKQVQDLCAICLRAIIYCLRRNNIEEAFIWSKVNFFKVEDKALASGGVLASSLRYFKISVSDMLLHLMILKLKMKYFGTNVASLYEAYQDAMSQSRLTDRNVNMPEKLFQGLDQLIVKNAVHIGQSLRKENFETIHIVKFQIIAIHSIKNDLEDVTVYSICMVKAYRTAAFCFECTETLYDSDAWGDTNLMMLRRRLALCYYENEQWDLAEETLERNLLRHPSEREAVDIILMIQALLANNELIEASAYLLCLPKSKGYNISMSDFITDVQKHLNNYTLN